MMIMLRSYYLLIPMLLNQDFLQWNQELMSGGAVELNKILGSKYLENIIFNLLTYIHDTIFSLKGALVLVLVN